MGCETNDMIWEVQRFPHNLTETHFVDHYCVLGGGESYVLFLKWYFVPIINVGRTVHTLSKIENKHPKVGILIEFRENKGPYFFFQEVCPFIGLPENFYLWVIPLFNKALFIPIYAK